mmetsp:Transcript_79489/g.208757  ORF Transcript_79489/g.208757 Transcript_79489/m.208757 type:complete len:228 (+) Transcript_79489:72-755(+)
MQRCAEDQSDERCPRKKGAQGPLPCVLLQLSIRVTPACSHGLLSLPHLRGELALDVSCGAVLADEEPALPAAADARGAPPDDLRVRRPLAVVVVRDPSASLRDLVVPLAQGAERAPRSAGVVVLEAGVLAHEGEAPDALQQEARRALPAAHGRPLLRAGLERAAPGQRRRVVHAAVLVVPQEDLQHELGRGLVRFAGGLGIDRGCLDRPRSHIAPLLPSWRGGRRYA